MTGRCWPQDGTGGTLNAGGTGPGPYYRYATAGLPLVGGVGPAGVLTQRAVWYAVKAIQRALNRRLGGSDVRVDGVFGLTTAAAATKYQQREGLPADGVVGPLTCKSLFTPVCAQLATSQVPACLLMGQIQNESAWDPGTVGYVDDRDLGLAQINGKWHPDYTEQERFAPLVAVAYVVELYENNLATFDGYLPDAVAAYNLGATGARSWVNAGRPDVWNGRDVAGYVDRILSNCPPQ